MKEDAPNTEEFNELRAWLELSRFIHIVGNHDGTEKIARARGMEALPRSSHSPEGLAFLISPEVEIQNPPRPHQGSDAIYHVDGHRFLGEDGREHMLFVSSIEKGGKTTSHTHEKSPEHYFLFSGEVAKNGEPFKKYTRVNPGETHVITANSAGGFLIILLEDVTGIPDDQLHVQN